MTPHTTGCNMGRIPVLLCVYDRLVCLCYKVVQSSLWLGIAVDHCLEHREPVGSHLCKARNGVVVWRIVFCKRSVEGHILISFIQIAHGLANREYAGLYYVLWSPLFIIADEINKLLGCLCSCLVAVVKYTEAVYKIL